MARKRSQKRRQDARRPSRHYSPGESLFEAAKNAHRSGNLHQACECYRQVISSQPQHADALHLLGFAEFQSSRFTDAIPHLQAAVSLCPQNGEFQHNLALAHLANRNLERAMQHAAEARRLGHLDGHGFLHVGWELFQKNETELAESAYRLSLLAEPNSADANHVLGVLNAEQQKWGDAIRFYERTLELEPTCIEVMNNLANLCRDLGRVDDAVNLYRRALQLEPRSAEVICNLGVSLRQLGQIAQAIGCFRRAIMLSPSSSLMHQHLAAALADEGRVRDAATCYEHLAKLDPSQPLWKLRAASFCPAVFPSRDHMEQFTSRFTATIANVRSLPWRVDLNGLMETAPACPFPLQFLDGNLKPLKESFAAVFSERLTIQKRAAWIDAWTGSVARPRIGLVVTDGHERIFMKSIGDILTRMPGEWEFVVFCSHRGVAKLQAELVGPNFTVTPLSVRLDHMADTISESRCDLLYYWEIGTDVANYFLPFLRLAPVQITSWGVQVTSGIPNVDGYMSSVLLESSDAQDHYTERLVLGQTMLAYRHRTQLPAVVRGRETFGVPTDLHWYACPQQIGKFHVDFDSHLAAVLRRDPTGAVILVADTYGHQAAELRRRFERSMPDVSARIHFLPRLDHASYLSLLHHAEVLLDPPHFGGVNTTYDALSFNKPVVASPSNYNRGRYTLGCYRKMGWMECVTQSLDEYVELATKIGTDRDFRHELSRQLSQVTDAIFEDDQAVDDHVQIFTELLQAKGGSVLR